MKGQTLADIQATLRANKLTMVELVSSYLDRCEEIKDHNAYVEVFADEVLAKAKVLDQKIKEQNPMGPLFGAVVSIKDNICYQDHYVSAGSKMLENFKAPYSATVVQRLLDADALIIGRTNCDEFSMGSTNESSFYGPVKNAIDPTRVAGGSSGGGAVAVALNSCLVSLGSDTGGSIRQPGAYNGMIAYKPTYGAISRWGLIAYGSSLDVIGLLGHSVQDLRSVMAVVSGPDNYDSTAVEIDLNKKTDHSESRIPKIAYSSKLLNNPSISSAIRDSSNKHLEELENRGYQMVEVDLKYEDYYVPTYYILATAEASSNLNRYDGIRYGHRTTIETDDYKEMMKLSRTEGFGKEVKKRIMLGTYVLSEGYYEAYYQKAQQVRSLIKAQVEEILTTNDFLLLPTATLEPKKIGGAAAPLEAYLSDLCTVLANLCGYPAISYPINNIKGNLSLSMQLLAQSKQDEDLLSISESILTN